MSFDWVTARFSCSLANTFATLGEIVKSEVSIANELMSPERQFFVNIHPREIVVARTHPRESAAKVVFDLTATDICASAGDGKPFLCAKPILNEEGECLLDVGGKYLKLWQLSRKVLENLFFGG